MQSGSRAEIIRPNLASDRYVLGYTQGELDRLARQAAFFAVETADLLGRAGLQRGARVLDLGCGIGDVSMAAARIVGASGSVLGLDRSAEAIATARQRCSQEGLAWVEFAERTLDDLPVGTLFDAVIGRFILVHLPEPEDLMRRVVKVLKPGGIIAFAELDIGSASITPPAALFQRCLGWIMAVYKRSGLEPNMGSNLFRVFRSAGLTPDLSAACRMTGGAESSSLAYLADTIRSMMPALEKFGIADAATVGIEDLRDRLATEATEGDHCIAFARFVGASARMPA